MHLDLTEPKVAAWIESLKQANCTIGQITPLSIQNKANGELLFAYLHADVTAPEGYKLLPIIFLRGDAVVVVPEIINKDTGEKKFLMVEQRRIASGEIHLEFPAGMLDREIGNPAAVAIKEVFEETGLELDESKLRLLWDKPLFSSPGASDEKIWFFGIKVELCDKEFCSLDGRLRNNYAENEYIRTTTITEKRINSEAKSTQTILGYLLNKKG